LPETPRKPRPVTQSTQTSSYSIQKDSRHNLGSTSALPVRSQTSAKLRRGIQYVAASHNSGLRTRSLHRPCQGRVLHRDFELSSLPWSTHLFI
jgi:hypothetical protein